jgi:putative selenium metabolism hydrolase
MGYHPVQGYPSIAVTHAEADTASLNAVPHQFIIYLDRRITLTEPRDEVIAQIKGLIPDYLQDEIQVEELFYDAPSYTGFTFPVSKFYPPWLLEDEHPLTQAGQSTIEVLWGEKRELGTWDFSTNGTYWAGKAGIPSIGFGPGDEKFAHTSLEQVPLEEVVAATEFYALFPKMLAEKVE